MKCQSGSIPITGHTHQVETFSSSHQNGNILSTGLCAFEFAAADAAAAAAGVVVVVVAVVAVVVVVVVSMYTPKVDAAERGSGVVAGSDKGGLRLCN